MIEYRNKDNGLNLSLFVSIHNCKFGKKNFIGSHVSILNSSIGDFSYVNSNTVIQNAIIGKFCSISSDVKIGLGKHPLNMVSTHPVFYTKSNNIKTFVDKNIYKEYDNVTIGNDVWIGTRVLICDGVIIGDGAVISAGSIVTKNVHPYSIIGGIPARVIKYRFTHEIIEFLLDFKWWDKSELWIKNNYLLFHDINKFIQVK